MVETPPPIPIVQYRDIYYCDALGGNSPKVNDHLRQFLSSVSWLPALAPKLEGQVIDFQLQTNLLLVLLTIHNGESLWSDLARFYAQRVLPLVNKIKYKPEFRKQVANLFNINNWGIPNLNVSSSSFGQVTNQQDGTPGSQAGPRSIQMALRLIF